MTSIQTIAPRDEARSFMVKIKNEKGITQAELPITYYRNRITLAGVKWTPTEEDLEKYTDAEISNIESAATICHYVKEWDITGPALDNEGNLVLDSEGNPVAGEGDLIPLDPRVVMYVPTLIIGEIMKQLTEEVFPNSRPSRNERRRSR